jgi:sterol desaturase/sphingolipid hydroxylase (fatty acid hydroxylase superfamily)
LHASALYLGGYCLLLVIVAAMEMFRPMHRSPNAPKGRLLTNFGMGVINVAIATVIPLSIVAAARWARTEQIGLLNLVPVPGVVSAAITIAVRSLAAYWLHRAMHASRLLWRVHRVHHCDVAIDLSTGFRNHPIEALIISFSMMSAAILAGLDPTTLAVFELAIAAANLWAHANLGMSHRVERSLRALLVTPDMHHVHHSATQNQTDSNYGEVFSVWDRMFGTHCAVDRAALQILRFGLGEEDDRQAGNLLHQLGGPLRRQSAGPAGANRNIA